MREQLPQLMARKCVVAAAVCALALTWCRESSQRVFFSGGTSAGPQRLQADSGAVTFDSACPQRAQWHNAQPSQRKKPPFAFHPTLCDLYNFTREEISRKQLS